MPHTYTDPGTDCVAVVAGESLDGKVAAMKQLAYYTWELDLTE